VADDKGDEAAPRPVAPSVLKRPASQVAAAQAERSAQAVAVEQVMSPGPAATPLDAAHTKPGDILRVHVDPRHVIGSEQADHGAAPRPWVVISMRYAHKMPLNLVVAVPLTTKLHHEGEFRRARIAIPAQDMTSTHASWTPENSLALTEQVRAISVERCSCKLGEVSPRIVSSLRGAVGYIIGLV
jgi:mRNA-degrading endonuclease toxin of MazEF toxin-antitoxin module